MPQKKPQSRLAQVQTGRQQGARRFCFYGPESVGKTTLAAHAPAPIFIDIEDGSRELNVARYMFGDTVTPPSFDAVLFAVEDLIANEHDFKSVVIDSVDRLESLIWQHVCAKHSGVKSATNKGGKKLTSIEDFGFGKGFNVSAEQLRGLLSRLEVLARRRRMHVIFVGHSQVKLFKNPEGDDYDRYWLRAHDKFAGDLKEWCDVVGFCTFDEGGGKLDPSERARGWSTGRRLIKLTRTAAYDAKTRIPLPSEIEMATRDPWAPFAEAMRVGQQSTPKDLLKLIDEELERIGDADYTKTVKAACRGRDAATLGRYLMKLKSQNPKEGEEEDNG